VELDPFQAQRGFMGTARAPSEVDMGDMALVRMLIEKVPEPPRTDRVAI